MKRTEFKRYVATLAIIPAIGCAAASFYVPEERIEFLALGVGLWALVVWAGKGRYRSSHVFGTFQNHDGSWPTDEEAEALRKLPPDAPFIHFAWPFASLTNTYQEPNQPLQRNASTGSVSNFQSPARRG